MTPALGLIAALIFPTSAFTDLCFGAAHGEGADQVGVQGVGAGTTLVGGGATRGDVEMAPASSDFDRPPEWVRRPDPSLVGMVYPTQAMRSGRDGSADVKCTLTVDSALTKCSVVSEAPADNGFGAAALGLMPEMNLRPAMKNGQPVASEVTFSVTYHGPGIPTGSQLAGIDTRNLQKLLSNAEWTTAPTYAQVVAAYPTRARAEQVGGRVSLFCTFNDQGGITETCQVTNEEPTGYGFGDAALALSRAFSVPATLADGTSVGGAGYRLPFTFSTRMLQPDAVATGMPTFVALPTQQDLTTAFPREAIRAGMGVSRVVLKCDLIAGGALSSCAVKTETPTGLGFGQGALALSSKFRMSQWSDEGLPTVGGKIQLPVGYNLEVRQQATAR